MMVETWMKLTVAGTLCDVLALAFLAICLGTELWTTYTVDRDAVLKDLPKASDNVNSSFTLSEAFNTSKMYYSRQRGLLRTCYEDYKVGEDFTCFDETGYELSGMGTGAPSVEWSSYYEMHVHLMRFLFLCIILGLAFNLAEAAFAFLACANRNIRAYRTACVVGVMGTIFTAGAMATYQGLDYLESEKITDKLGEIPAMYPAGWKKHQPTLYKNTDVKHSVAYYLGWVAVVLSAIAAVLFYITSRKVVKNQVPENRLAFVNYPTLDAASSKAPTASDMDRKNSKRSSMNSKRTSVRSDDQEYYESSLARNRAYDHVVEEETEEDLELDENMFATPNHQGHTRM